MARPLRARYPGFIHHVINRREPIFREDQDQILFLKTLGEARDKTA